MKTILNLLPLLVLLVFAAGCQVEPKPIAYGTTNCAHCHMTVTDSRYGAEIVNDKGKAFFFDSAECMVAYLHEQQELKEKASFILVTDFTKPNELIDARSAHYLQSKSLPSPMGMYLTAMGSEEAARKMEQEHGGRLLTWEQAVAAVQKKEKPVF